MNDFIDFTFGHLLAITLILGWFTVDWFNWRPKEPYLDPLCSPLAGCVAVEKIPTLMTAEDPNSFMEYKGFTPRRAKRGTFVPTTHANDMAPLTLKSTCIHQLLGSIIQWHSISVHLNDMQIIMMD